MTSSPLEIGRTYNATGMIHARYTVVDIMSETVALRWDNAISGQSGVILRPLGWCKRHLS